MDNEETEILDIVPPKKKVKKRGHVIALCFVLLILITVAVTSYAYFSASILNSGTINNTVVTTTSLEIEFTDGSTVNLANALPGSYIEKTFKVENKGSGDTTYDVYMSDLINSFADKSDLKYTLTSNDGGFNVSVPVQVPDTSSKIVENKLLRAGQSHNYTLRIDFLETNDNQDDNKGKTFSTIIRVNEVQNALISNYTISSGDLNTIGSVVKIDTEEFYVIGQGDENHVKLLAKWNLNVGSNPKGTATNLQNEDVRGYVNDTSPGYIDGMQKYGEITYSTDGYWHDSTNNKLKDEYGGYIYNQETNRYEDGSGNSIVPYVYTNAKENGNYIVPLAEYIDTYVDYLNNKGAIVTGRLIKKEELEALGCDDINRNCSLAPSWVYQTSYWTGSAGSSGGIWGLISNKTFINSVNYSEYYGVRPVIILEK